MGVSMAHQVLVPPLGQTVDTVTIVTWYKQEGEVVREGEPLFAIETDKAVLDIEAQASGVLRGITAAKGDEVEVLSPIAVIGVPGDESEHQAARGTVVTVSAPETEAAGPVEARPASERVASSPVVATRGRNGRLFVSPRARRLAEVEGVALADLAGSGPEGSIVERDVRQHLASRPTTAVAPAVRVSYEPPGALTAAVVTLSSEADARQLVALRTELLASDRDVSYDALYLHILARALVDHPALNVSLGMDGMHPEDGIHVGIIILSDVGLRMPIVRDVARKRLVQLSREISDLSARVRTSALDAEELEGATFALANLGAAGADTFSPLIASPATAVLGVGRIKPASGAGESTQSDEASMWLSLSFDSRLVGVGRALQFLQAIVRLIEEPFRLLA